MSITNYIKERTLELKENLKTVKNEWEFSFIMWKIYELQAVLSKIQELQKEERIQNLEQLIKMAKEDNQDTSYMEWMLKWYKDLLEFSS